MVESDVGRECAPHKAVLATYTAMEGGSPAHTAPATWGSQVRREHFSSRMHWVSRQAFEDPHLAVPATSVGARLAQRCPPCKDEVEERGCMPQPNPSLLAVPPPTPPCLALIQMRWQP